jgi:hypothetical protein
MEVAFKILILWKLTYCLEIATDVSGEYVASISTSKNAVVIHPFYPIQNINVIGVGIYVKHRHSQCLPETVRREILFNMLHSTRGC